jgi:hypothetical protein
MNEVEMQDGSVDSQRLLTTSATCMAAALALDVLLTKAIKNCQTKAPDEPAADAKITLDANGVSLASSKGKTVEFWSGDDILVNSSKNIRFFTQGKGEIVWDKMMVVNQKTKKVEIKRGTFKHPSIEAK